MNVFLAKGLIIKIVVITVFYFLDVAMSSSESSSMHHELRSDLIRPVAEGLNNELSDIEDFEELESRISRLMRRYDIKGASVAVAKNGRLVFAKGFGYADTETGQPVEPGHMFRIASVSKLVTAVAIMKMQEQGLLDLDDKVFGPDAILNDEPYLDYVDRRAEDITVRHLLIHSAGWNRRFGDHMFMPHLVARDLDIELPVHTPDIIRFALRRRLHFSPGTGTSYSNLGYAILGEIIEKISGRRYEQYVQQSILYPLDILDMRIGRNLENERFEREVKYYGTPNAPVAPSIYDAGTMVSRHYGGNDIETLGAAGGWIASPAELLKLVAAIDNESGMPTILSDHSISSMINRSSRGRLIGWTGNDSRGNLWRTGSFAGTTSVVTINGNGLSWAVIFNSSTYRGSSLSREINGQMHTALNNIENWPDHDLFYLSAEIPELTEYRR